MQFYLQLEVVVTNIDSLLDCFVKRLEFLPTLLAELVVATDGVVFNLDHPLVGLFPRPYH